MGAQWLLQHFGHSDVFQLLCKLKGGYKYWVRELLSHRNLIFLSFSARNLPGSLVLNSAFSQCPQLLLYVAWAMPPLLPASKPSGMLELPGLHPLVNSASAGNTPFTLLRRLLGSFLPVDLGLCSKPHCSFKAHFQSIMLKILPHAQPLSWLAISPVILPKRSLVFC